MELEFIMVVMPGRGRPEAGRRALLGAGGVPPPNPRLRSRVATLGGFFKCALFCTYLEVKTFH